MTAAPVDAFARAIASAAQHAWNESQDRYRFRGMRCARAGRVDRQAAFVCRSRVTDRHTGQVRELRVVLVADGTAVG